MSHNIGVSKLACQPAVPYSKEVRSSAVSVLFSKITAKAQTTVPKEVREALGVKPGDMLVYRISKGRVTLARA
jgi:AbrB family looped-hinge helix DNA binding protein